MYNQQSAKNKESLVTRINHKITLSFLTAGAYRLIKSEIDSKRVISEVFFLNRRIKRLKTLFCLNRWKDFLLYLKSDSKDKDARKHLKD